MNRSSTWKYVGVFVATIAVFSVVVYVLILSMSGIESLGREVGIGLFFRTYPGLIVAMTAGFLGAAFSMLLQSRNRASRSALEHISGAASWHTLIVRGSVGLGAAAILYFFFESGLLEGTLWPDLNALGYDRLNESTSRLVPNKAWCLLIIWCFVAGFSEAFVPNILARTEKVSESS